MVLQFPNLSIKSSDSTALCDSMGAAELSCHLPRTVVQVSDSGVIWCWISLFMQWDCYHHVLDTLQTGHAYSIALQGFELPGIFKCGPDDAENWACYSVWSGAYPMEDYMVA